MTSTLSLLHFKLFDVIERKDVIAINLVLTYPLRKTVYQYVIGRFHPFIGHEGP